MKRLAQWLVVGCLGGTFFVFAGCPARSPEVSGPSPPASGGGSYSSSQTAGDSGLTKVWGPLEGEVIKLGSFMCLTGNIATYGQSSNRAMGLAVEEINEAGGVLGRPLQLIVEDDASKQEEARNAVQKLITKDRVVLVIGEVASSNSKAAAPVCQSNKVPMLTPSSTNPEITKKGDYIFRSCFTDDQQGAYIASYAFQKLGMRRVAMLTDLSSDYSKGLQEYITAAFEKMGGQVVTTLDYTQGEKDFSAQMTQLKAASIDGIFLPGYYEDVALIIKEARRQGIDLPFVGGDGWDSPKLVELGGEAINKDCFFTNHYSVEDTRPTVQKFVQAFRQRYGQDPDALAACAYDAVHIVAQALERAGTTEAAALRDALAATRDFDGVTGNITINEERNCTKSCVVVTIRDGRQKVIATMNPTDITGL